MGQPPQLTRRSEERAMLPVSIASARRRIEVLASLAILAAIAIVTEAGKRWDI